MTYTKGDGSVDLNKLSVDLSEAVIDLNDLRYEMIAAAKAALPYIQSELEGSKKVYADLSAVIAKAEAMSKK